MSAAVNDVDPVDHDEPRSAPGPRYRLVIEGDMDLMRQIMGAVELQGRVHLGQFEDIFREIEYAVYENARRDRILMTGGCQQTEEEEWGRRRFDQLMYLRDSLKQVWYMARREWEKSFRFPGSVLYKLSPHGSQRENRAYTLWKWMEHHLMHLENTQETEPPLRSNVHYEAPVLVTPEISVSLTKIKEN